MSFVNQNANSLSTNLVYHLVLVEDDLSVRKTTQKILELEGYKVTAFENPEDALKYFRDHSPKVDLILSDIRMPKMSGLDFLKAMTALKLEIPVILMTAFGSVEDAVWAMKWGVIDFITKPFKRTEILNAVEVALKKSERENAKKKTSSGSFTSSLSASMGTLNEESQWIGVSYGFKKLKEEIALVAPTHATVLITGKSGTGKERVARELHSQSVRKKGPFIVINCAALPENLLESELFGFEKGAFTGADHAKVGLFESAHGGTLFLDEIGEMSLPLQAKLLRILSDGEVRRVGGVTSKKVSVRVVTATHQNLKEKVRLSQFREDLLYRLEVVHLVVPELRERKEDITELSLHFLRTFSIRHERKVFGISDDALECLKKYDWPGNIRELQNVIERAVVFSKTDEISRADLPIHIEGAAKSPSSNDDPSDIHIKLGTSLKDVEELLIRKTLDHSKGDKNLTAKLLGINSRTIYRKLQEKEPE